MSVSVAICASVLGHIVCEVKQGDSLISLMMRVLASHYVSCFISLSHPRLLV